MTSTSRHSASRCLRITAVARARPRSDSCRCRSPSTVSRPSRSIRATVWLTVGPLCRRRSAMRARRGTIPSSSSSNTVRRYISVVSMRSFTGLLRLRLRWYGGGLHAPPRRAGGFPHRAASRAQVASRWAGRRPAGRRRRGGRMSDSVAVVWDDALLGYTMGGDPPLPPVRLDLPMRLADSLGVLAGDRMEVVTPEPAGVELLTLVHDPASLEAVKRAPADPGVGHGLGTPDNPIFEGMYDAAALIAGGSVQAAQEVHEGRAQPGVSISGGLHHAMRDAASGFCIFNDAAIAIRWLLEQGYQRIAYVDVDVHHGDGVQAAFWNDPRVLTVSIHQTPLTLFPGTGFPEETGDPQRALGSAVNLALPNGTDDSAWLRAFSAVVPSVVKAFQPQIIVTQCGCDAHHEDPLADLALTVDGQRASYKAMHELAHQVCDGRWVVLGGGGYGLVRCVPRAWTHLIAEASGDPVPPDTEIPQSWQDDVRSRGLRTPSPVSMTEGAYVGFHRWDPFTENRVDRAIMRTRTAAFPYFGLDPDGPRD